MPFELYIQRYPHPTGEDTASPEDVAGYGSLEEWLDEEPPDDPDEFERRSNELSIGLDEWCEAVEAIAGVRLVQTGTGGESVAEVDVSGEWIPVFRWRSDAIVFNGLVEYDDPQHPVRVAAAALARHLGAIINDDDFGFLHW